MLLQDPGGVCERKDCGIYDLQLGNCSVANRLGMLCRPFSPSLHPICVINGFGLGQLFSKGQLDTADLGFEKCLILSSHVLTIRPNACLLNCTTEQTKDLGIFAKRHLILIAHPNCGKQ